MEAVMTIERVHLYEDLRRGMEQLRSTQPLLRQSEKLSIRGEMAAEAVLGESLLRVGVL